MKPAPILRTLPVIFLSLLAAVAVFAGEGLVTLPRLAKRLLRITVAA